jgi:hypothetical protein
MSNTLCPAPVQYKIVLGCKVPHELDALKWKAIGRRRKRRRRLSIFVIAHGKFRLSFLEL